MSFLRAMSFKNRIFLVFTSTFLATIFLSGFIVFGVVMPAMQDSNVKYEGELVRQAARRIDDYLAQFNAMCVQVSYSSFTRSILLKNYSGAISEKLEYSKDCFEAFRFYQAFSIAFKGIVGIFVYNRHGWPYYFTSKEPVASDLNARQQWWYASLASTDDFRMIIFSGIQHPPQIPGSRSHTVSLIRNIRSIADFGIIGQAEILIDPRVFGPLLEGTGPQYPHKARSMTLVDGAGKIICSDNPAHRQGEPYSTAVVSRLRDTAEPDFQSLEGSRLLSARRSAYSGWYLISEARADAASRSYREVLNLFVAFGALSFLLIIAQTLLISREITKPIALLQQRVNELKTGNFDNPIALKDNDEFASLMVGMNEMSRKLKENIQRIYLIEEQKRNAEILALQSQINPHFTLNTLNAIKYLAALQNSNNIVGMLEDFTLLVQAALKAPNELISLEEELNRVRAFMRIQEVRFFGKIRLEIEDERGAGEFLTMGLILQPIVENAISHGIQPKMESHQIQTGRIRISVRTAGDDLEIHVVDDGVGISEEDVKRVFSQTSPHIGLHNVNTRIKLRFGERYGLSIASAPGQGCDVLVRLPRIRRQDTKTDGFR